MPETNASDRELRDGEVGVRGAPGMEKTLAEVALHTCYFRLSVHNDPSLLPVVEVDRETGKVNFLAYVVVHDCGTLVNRTTLAGHVRGRVAQGRHGAMRALSLRPRGSERCSLRVSSLPDPDSAQIVGVI